MQPSKHSREARLARIREAEKANQPPAQPRPRPADAVELAPGLEFLSRSEIRTVPKVKPRGMAQMRAALSKSVVWKAGTRFRVLAKAAKPGAAQYWRVAVIVEGEPVHKGFINENTTYGKIEIAEAA